MRYGLGMERLNCDLGGFGGWAVICVGRGLSESGFAGFSRIFRIVGDGDGGLDWPRMGSTRVMVWRGLSVVFPSGLNVRCFSLLVV